MTELQLINSAKNGDTNCFSQLVSLYQKKLYRFLLGHCQNQQDAEDALQEAFIHAFKYIKTYDVQWKFSTWLFTLASRILSAKQRKFSNHHTPDNMDEFVGHHATLLHIPDNNLWKIIRNKVSAEIFDVLWFFYAEDLTLAEVAVILDRSESWIKINLYRTKQNLAKLPSIRELMEQDFEERDGVN